MASSPPSHLHQQVSLGSSGYQLNQLSSVSSSNSALVPSQGAPDREIYNDSVHSDQYQLARVPSHHQSEIEGRELDLMENSRRSVVSLELQVENLERENQMSLANQKQKNEEITDLKMQLLESNMKLDHLTSDINEQNKALKCYQDKTTEIEENQRKNEEVVKALLVQANENLDTLENQLKSLEEEAAANRLAVMNGRCSETEFVKVKSLLSDANRSLEAREIQVKELQNTNAKNLSEIAVLRRDQDEMEVFLRQLKIQVNFPEQNVNNGDIFSSSELQRLSIHIHQIVYKGLSASENLEEGHTSTEPSSASPSTSPANDSFVTMAESSKLITPLPQLQRPPSARRLAMLHKTRFPAFTTTAEKPTSSRAQKKLDSKNKNAQLKHVLVGSRNGGADRNWRCSCGCKYTAKSTLLTHIRSFTMDWKFTCEQCSAKFFALCHLKLHMTEVHGDAEPLKGYLVGCCLCGTMFASKTDYQQHRLFFHHQPKTKTPGTKIKTAVPKPAVSSSATVSGPSSSTLMKKIVKFSSAVNGQEHGHILRPRCSLGKGGQAA